MGEEFQESEVMFQLETENQVGNVIPSNFCSNEWRNDDSKVQKRKNKAMRNNRALSVPVKIPDADHWYKYVDMEVCDDGELVPPHVITGHRVAGKMIPFSVCTGNGRTLKGKDLSQVRNTILKMTGFLET